MQIKVPTWLLVAGGIVLVCLLVGAAYVGRISALDPPEKKPAFTYEPRPLLKEEWFEPQTPSFITAYEVPDTSQTTEYCGIFPEGLIGETNRPRDTPTPNGDSLGDSPDAAPPIPDGVGPSAPSSVPDLELKDEPFLAVPLQNGTPTVRVTSTQFALQGYLPSSGRGVEFSWDVPQPKNAIEVTAQTRVWESGIGATIDAQYVRDLGLVDLMAGPGWRGAPTDKMSGWYGTVGIRVKHTF